MDELANCVTCLLMAKDCAIKGNLNHYFIAELDHLVSTAKANMEETK